MKNNAGLGKSLNQTQGTASQQLQLRRCGSGAWSRACTAMGPQTTGQDCLCPATLLSPRTAMVQSLGTLQGCPPELSQEPRTSPHLTDDAGHPHTSLMTQDIPHTSLMTQDTSHTSLMTQDTPTPH